MFRCLVKIEQIYRQKLPISVGGDRGLGALDGPEGIARWVPLNPFPPNTVDLRSDTELRI